MESQNLNIFENGLDERSKAYLLETTRWTKFLAILGFISIGFILLFAVAMLGGGSDSTYSSTGMFATLGKVGFVIYFLVIAVVYFFPAYFLMKFSSSMKSGIQTNNVENITEGFRHQKNLFKYMGILAIIGIALVLVVFIFAGVLASTGRGI
jgi:hypothetical protein